MEARYSWKNELLLAASTVGLQSDSCVAHKVQQHSRPHFPRCLAIMVGVVAPQAAVLWRESEVLRMQLRAQSPHGQTMRQERVPPPEALRVGLEPVPLSPRGIGPSDLGLFYLPNVMEEYHVTPFDVAVREDSGSDGGAMARKGL